MSYINCLDIVASKLLHPSLDLPRWAEPEELTGVGVLLAVQWCNLEGIARVEQYDVLPGSDLLRRTCVALMRNLYSIPDARVQDDLTQLREKDREYGGSWQRRGGQGAFFAACRKWDRVETQLSRHGNLAVALEMDKREEGILDDLGDLRRYLILWESWRIALESQHLATVVDVFICSKCGRVYDRLSPCCPNCGVSQ